MVLREDRVRLQERRVDIFKYRLDVRAVARPVHEPCSLIGAVVEVVDPDRLRDLPGDRLVLVRRDLALQRDDQPEPRMRGAVLMRRVDRHRAAVDPVQGDAGSLLPEVRRSEVRVQRQDLPGLHASVPPVSSGQVSADEAADVLQLVLLVLRLPHIVGMGLPGGLAPGQSREQRRPADLPVLPDLLEAARAFADQELTVIAYVYFSVGDVRDLRLFCFCHMLLLL